MELCTFSNTFSDTVFMGVGCRFRDPFARALIPSLRIVRDIETILPYEWTNGLMDLEKRAGRTAHFAPVGSCESDRKTLDS